MAEERAERRLAAILAADVVGYSRLIGADEEGTLNQLRSIRAELIDPKITEHHGRVVKTTGDGLLVEFGSVVDGLRYATEWQRGIAEATTAVETTKETLWEAEVHRIAGEIALMSPEPAAPKAQAYFERALAVARVQQAKSLELRAAMSMARLWRDQGKRDEARALLAPVYGWFTEGFDI